MKIKMRSGVFETNSSSMHSICVVKEVKTKRNIVSYNGVAHIGASENNVNYDRYPFRILFNVNQKITFAIANFYPGECIEDSDKFKEITNKYLKMVQKHYPEVEKFSYNWSFEFLYYLALKSNPDKLYLENDERVEFIDVINSKEDRPILKETGEELIWMDLPPALVYDFGSCETNILQRFIKEKGITEEEFIFNPKYFVVIDGDEYLTFKEMEEQGLITNIEDKYICYS